MAFIASHWLIWLIGLIFCLGVMIYGQLKFMNNFKNPYNRKGDLFSNPWVTVLFLVLGTALGVMLAIASIIHMVRYLQS